MDAETCLKKLQYVGVLAFATTDGQGNPQVRNISAIHYEPDAIYFFTARGKDFCRELLSDGRVQVLGYTRYKEMIRLSAKAEAVSREEQEHWIDTIFRESYTMGGGKISPKGYEITEECIGCGPVWNTVRRDASRRDSRFGSGRNTACTAEIVLSNVRCLRSGGGYETHGISFLRSMTK